MQQVLGRAGSGEDLHASDLVARGKTEVERIGREAGSPAIGGSFIKRRWGRIRGNGPINPGRKGGGLAWHFF